MNEPRPLKIVVCVKEVAHVYAPADFDRKSERIDQNCVVKVINPFDEYALEWALHLKRQQNRQCTVAVLTFGEDQAKEMLSYCAALGADEAYLIREDDFPPLDPWTRALVLSHGVQKAGFDLVLCGKQAVDDNLGLVGGYLAHFLKTPWVSDINQVDFNETRQELICHKMVGKTKMERVKISFPVVLMAEKGGITLGYPALPGIANSRRRAITEWKGSDLGLNPQELAEQRLTRDIRTIPPKPKPMFTIDSSLSAADRLKMIMGGGLAKKTDTKLLEGKKEDIVPKVVQYLIDQISPI